MLCPLELCEPVMNEESQIDNRVSWIDAFKGLAILLVVWSHCRTDEINYAARFPWGCHMPAFFFIAGVTLNIKCSWRDFVAKRVATILWPLAVASIAYWWFMPNSRGQVLTDTLTFDGSGPLWFLSAYFIAIHLARHAAILSLNRLAVGIFIVIGISLFFLAGRIPELIHANRAYIVYRALLATAFIYCGWLARDFVKNVRLAYLCLPALGYLAMVKFMKPYFIFDLHYATIPNALVYLSLALCGISLLVVLSRMIGKLSRGGGVCQIGRSSLCLMIVHWIAVYYCRSVVVGLPLSPTLKHLALFSIVFPWSIGVTMVVSRYFPWALRLEMKGH